MSELPCITVYFLPTVCIDCFLYLKTEMHSYCIQSCVLLCPGDVLFCSEPSFRRPHLGYISTFCFCAGFTVPGHPWRLWFIVQWQRLGSRLIFSVWRDTFFNTIGLWGCLLCKKHVVFWWHGHGHCCWSISPSAALVHWAVCLFFCHSHGVIGHMALQSHLESKLGQQNLCPVGCSVLSGALCYCGNL